MTYEQALDAYRAAVSVDHRARAARACIAACEALANDGSQDGRVRATWHLTRDNWQATLDTLTVLGANV